MIRTRRHLPVLLTVVAVATTACVTNGGLTPTPPSDPAPTIAPTVATTSTTSTTTTIPRDCPPVAGPLPAGFEGSDPSAVSVALSAATFPCANEVTIALAADTGTTRRAAAHAASAGGPLLLIADDAGAVSAELRRLDPHLVTLAGGLAPASFSDFETRPLPVTQEIRGTLVQGTDAARLLVVGPGGEAAWPSVWAAASAAGDTAVLTGADPRGMPDARLAATRSASGASATVIGGDDDTAWQTGVVRSGTELPGGGLLMFPDRRLVAFYGHPQTGVLGVLGEQGVDGAAATIERMLPIVESYGADGVLPVPAFEIIATVASAEATSDGDYSRVTPLDILRPWVETAGEQGVYVILDLQPGRTDFLTQAMIYEEFLRLPHVGLAIDPEWRLKANQVHLVQVGSVEAAEINAVAEWLAGIVREDALPQKLLLLHQFQIRMLPDRSDVAIHPELAVAVQMDGWGTLPAKYGTWGLLTSQSDAERLWWGWKNFIDEDGPMATPAEVLDLDPTVYLVSFQ